MAIENSYPDDIRVANLPHVQEEEETASVGLIDFLHFLDEPVVLEGVVVSARGVGGVSVAY
jgi:hypothetical protein